MPTHTTFSTLYCDYCNYHFYMHLDTMDDGSYEVTYFTQPRLGTGAEDGPYDWVRGRFPSPKALTAYMFKMRDGGKQNMTARLWLYAEGLWQAEIERLGQTVDVAG